MLVGPSSVTISCVVNYVWLENSYKNLVLDVTRIDDEYSKVSSFMVIYELPDLEATNFYKLMEAILEPSWDKCDKQSNLFCLYTIV